MNSVGLIGVVVLAVILDISWAAYYLVVQFVFASGLTRGISWFVAVPLMIYPIYSGLPWWYNLLIFQYLLVACTTLSFAERVSKGEMEFEEMQSLRATSERISGVLLLISFIGSLYWFFSNR